jgi:hypothetical protein
MRRATGEALTRASSCSFGRSGFCSAGGTPASTAFLFCGGAVSFSFASAGAGFSVSFGFSFGFSDFGASSAFGAFSFSLPSPGSPMNAIRWPTSTLPPSST